MIATLFCTWHYPQAEQIKSNCLVGTKQRLASLGQQGTADKNERQNTNRWVLPPTVCSCRSATSGRIFLFFLPITWWRQSLTSQSRSQSTLQHETDFAGCPLEALPCLQDAAGVGTDVQHSGCWKAVLEVGVGFGVPCHPVLCTQTQPWGCATTAARVGERCRNRLLLPGGGVRRNGTAESTAKLCFSRNSLSSSETHLVTDSTFIEAIRNSVNPSCCTLSYQRWRQNHPDLDVRSAFQHREEDAEAAPFSVPTPFACAGSSVNSQAQTKACKGRRCLGLSWHVGARGC